MEWAECLIWTKILSEILNGPYFGNSKEKIVHDLNLATPLCKINEVKTEFKKYFDPDTLEQAHYEGYQSCRFCFSEKIKKTLEVKHESKI